MTVSNARRRRALLLAGLCSVLLWGSACSTANGPDPGQATNENIFAFNEGVDHYVLEPVAKGWDFVLPDFVQTGISNFFANLRMIRTFVNDGLQGEGARAAQDLGRFFVNSTVGIVGFIDVADPIGIPHNREDFGQTLGRWGVPPGAYIVLPFGGPTTVRDLFATPVDIALYPTWAATGAGAVDLVNTRAAFLEEVAESRATAVDYYVFVRNAYLQNRERNVRNGEDVEAGGPDDDLYDVPTDEDDDDLYDLPDDTEGEDDDLE